MKKYLFILVGIIALPLFSIKAEAKETLISQSLNAFLQAQAVHVSGYANVTEYRGSSPFSSSYPLNSTNTYSITFDARHDYLTPGSLKAEQSVTVKNTSPVAAVIPGEFSSLMNFTAGSKVIGTDVYVQIPTLLLTLFSEKKDVSGDSIWIRINKSDIAELESDFPGISDLYDGINELNNAPSKFIKDKQTDWGPFINSFQLKKLSTKIITGNKVNIYSFTLNKTLLKSALVAKAKKEGIAGYDLNYEMKNIDDELKQTRIRQGYFLTYANTLLPHSASFILDNLDEKGKVETSIDFRINFSDYDVPIQVSAPAKFITAKQFYDQYIKSMFDGFDDNSKENEKYREDADIKSQVSMFRAQAEIVYDANGGTGYGVANGGSCSSAKKGSVFNPIVATGSVAQDAKNIVRSVVNTASNVKCYSNNDTEWAMSAKLKSVDAYYCADSTGYAGTIDSQINGSSCTK